MGRIDYSALKDLDKNLDRGGKIDIFLSQKNIDDTTFVRFLPPHLNLSGVYYLKVVSWFLNGKEVFISAETFGKPCFIQAEVDGARASGDRDLIKLIDDNKKLNKDTKYWIAILHLKCKHKRPMQPVSVEIIGDRPKILQAGPQLMKAINRIISSDSYIMEDVEDGIFDRVEGFNFKLNKSGSGFDTEYSATPDAAWEMDPEMYEENFDILTYAKDQKKNESYLKAKIRQFLYDEDIPTDVAAKQAAKDEARKEKYKALEAERKARKGEVEDTEEEMRKPSKTTSNGTGKPKPEPVNEDEDEEVEEKPVPRRGNGQATKPKPDPKIEHEDEDEFEEAEEVGHDEDEEEEVKPVTKTNKAATKTATKRTIASDVTANDDLDDLPF